MDKNYVFANRNMTGWNKYGGPMLIGGLGLSMIGFGLLLGMKGRLPKSSKYSHVIR